MNYRMTRVFLDVNWTMTLVYWKCCRGFTESSLDYDDWGAFQAQISWFNNMKKCQLSFTSTKIKNQRKMCHLETQIKTTEPNEVRITQLGWNLCYCLLRVVQLSVQIISPEKICWNDLIKFLIDGIAPSLITKYTYVLAAQLRAPKQKHLQEIFTRGGGLSLFNCFIRKGSPD